MQKQEVGDTAFSKITPEHHQLQIRTVGGKVLGPTVKPLLEDALLFNFRILERASIQVFQNFM